MSSIAIFTINWLFFCWIVLPPLQGENFAVFSQKVVIKRVLSRKALFSYFLLCNKKSRFDFADGFKVGDVRYKHLTQITIKVQLF